MTTSRNPISNANKTPNLTCPFFLWISNARRLHPLSKASIHTVDMLPYFQFAERPALQTVEHGENLSATSRCCRPQAAFSYKASTVSEDFISFWGLWFSEIPELLLFLTPLYFVFDPLLLIQWIHFWFVDEAMPSRTPLRARANFLLATFCPSLEFDVLEKRVSDRLVLPRVSYQENAP